MASTVDNRPTGEKLPSAMARQPILVSFDVDTTVTANQLAQNETMSLGTLEAGDTVLNAFVYVSTADTSVTAIDVGYTTDGTTGAQLVDGATVATTGYKAGLVASYPIVITADSIIVLTNKDADTVNEAIIKVYVLVVKMTP